MLTRKDEKRSFVIWGSSGHALVLGALIESLDGEVITFFDRDIHAKSALSNVPIYYGEEGFLSWIENGLPRPNVFGLVAIGGSRGQDRIQIQAMFESHGIQTCPVVHPRAFVCSTATLGNGTQVLANATVAASVKIGPACIVNHGAQVDHESTLSAGVHIAPGGVLCGCVQVGYCAMIGAGAIVLPRLKIGDHAVVGAGAVVTRDVPDNSVVVGNPARPLRSS